MTSANTFPQRWSRIDELQRQDHWYLTDGDVCHFLGEYTARAGYAYSQTNNLILNMKKSVDRRDRPEWRYKGQAIRTVANAFRVAVGQDRLDRITFVPVPPSKARTDPLYDDRLGEMLRLVRPARPLDVRELIVQPLSYDPAHLSDVRRGPEEIAEGYNIDTNLLAPQPEFIAVVDDVLTTGSHFKAVKRLLNEHLPGIPVIGLFIARRVPNSDDIVE